MPRIARLAVSEASMAHRRFQGLTQDHDFLMHGAARRRLAAFGHGFLVPVKAIFLKMRLSTSRR
jgi:hypothetical protein